MKVFTMKFCINCKHFLLSEGAPNKPELGRCAYKRPISMVTGLPSSTDNLPFANVARAAASKGTCGADGNLYEEKETTNV
jgi:hypothetical protein